GRIAAKIYGYMKVPVSNLIQSFKRSYSSDGVEIVAIAKNIKIEPDILYIFGPGSTTYYITKEMGLEKTLLGVDIIMDKNILVKDAKESDILSAIENRRAKIVVTPIGGQGFIFGRGNQQISAEVIKKVGKENIVVVATRSKLKEIDALRVDTGNLKLDEELKGEIDVITENGVVKFKID
ncbi:ATP-NAD kinase, partial [Archaeoglobales archaeon]